MKAFALAVLISALLLQGCVAAVVVGSAAVGTKAATDPRTVGTQVDDGTLELRVNSALSKDEQIKKQARINVTAYQGKVLLSGSVAEYGPRPRETNCDGRRRDDGGV
jgi:osmotically-inducible protein OsmY